MTIEIDPKSGFCFGVVRAITLAEEALRDHEVVYSLGDIVHNRMEVQRLESAGMRGVTHSQIESLQTYPLFVRAHGEPPTTFELAARNSIKVIDATCPVVAKLQQKVKSAYEQMSKVGGRVVLLGKRGHAEVVGLTGQVGGDVEVIEKVEELEALDFTRAIYLLSQTTQSIALFEQVAQYIKDHIAPDVELMIDDTICRQVSSREENLMQFSQKFDVIIFVSGRKSSNGRVLFEICKEANPRAYNLEEGCELQREWFNGATSVGICGATSTPKWLMQQVADAIAKF